MTTTTRAHASMLFAIAVAAPCATASAQSPPKQVVKPPIAQAWIDNSHQD